MVDRQSVQTTAVGGELGDDAGKQGKGRTRHRLVDTLGVLLLVVVTAASVQDASSATSIGPRMQGRVPRLQKILADHGYQQQGIEWFHTRYAWIVEMVQRPPQQRGFQVLPTRWIVERTLAWVDPYRRLSKDDE
jgi:putative transposase